MRLKSGGPCWLRQMGTFGLHMAGVLPWLFLWARCASTIDFCPALAAPVSPVQIIISPHCPEPGQAVVMGRLSLCICLQQYEEPPFIALRRLIHLCYVLLHSYYLYRFTLLSFDVHYCFESKLSTSIVQQYVSYWLLIFVYEYKQGGNSKGSHSLKDGRNQLKISAFTL